MKWKWFIIAALVAIPVVASSYWALTCPCDGTPGLYLRGAEATAPVTDWSIANQVPLCQLQVSGRILPHALNLNCWSSGGDLYLGCSGCEEKSWGKTAVANSRAKSGSTKPSTRSRSPALWATTNWTASGKGDWSNPGFGGPRRMQAVRTGGGRFAPFRASRC